MSKEYLSKESKDNLKPILESYLESLKEKDKKEVNKMIESFMTEEKTFEDYQNIIIFIQWIENQYDI